MKQIRIILGIGAGLLFLASAALGQLLPGATKGSFRYGAGGAATYSIAIDVPPGTGGMQPQLALRYSSHGGNGELGEGWSLQTGASAITRAGQSFELDGNRSAIQWTVDDPGTPDREGDRFLLDGEELILAGGTYGGDQSTYRTRMESWRKVICTNSSTVVPGPEAFQVLEKSGMRKEYGLYQAHRVQVNGGNSPVQKWRLSQVTDRYGNRMYYGYAHCEAGEKGGPDQCSPLEGVENHLRFISYTANANDPNMPQRVVEFVYEDRPDIAVRYLAGFPFKSTKRLQKIITYVDVDGNNDWGTAGNWETAFADDIVRKYELEYAESPITGASRLVALQEYDGQGRFLTPTTFAWSGELAQKGFALDTVAIQSLPVFGEVKSWANTLHKGKYNEGTHLIDLNGDGLKDLIQGKWKSDLGPNSIPEVTRRVVLNRGDHWEELSNHPYLTDWEAAGKDVDNDSANGFQGDGALFAGRGYFSGATPGFSMGTRMIDINGDGLPDMLQLLDSWEAHPDHDDDPCNCQKGCCSDGDFEYPGWEVQLLLNEGEERGWHLVQPHEPEYAWISQIPKTGLGVPRMAFDKVWRATRDIGPTDFESAAGGVRISDVNGDGLPDLVQAMYRSGSTKRVLINRGPDNPGWERNTIYETSFAQIPSTVGFSYESGTIDLTSDQGTRIEDLNGDGLPDLIALNKERSSWYTFPEVVRVYLNRGNDGGFVLDHSYTNSLKGNDGKGLLHFTRMRSDKTDQRGTRLIDVNGDGLPDLLSLLENGNQDVRKLLLNTGTEFVESNWTLPPAAVYFDFYKDGVTYDGGTRWADINQDGLPDLFNFIKGDGVHAGNARKDIYTLGFSSNFRGWTLNNSWRAGLPGTGSNVAYFTGVTGSPFNVYDFGTRIDDIDGDGRLDVVQLSQVDQLGTFKRIYTARRVNDPLGQTSVDKLVGVKDGIGAEMKFRYLPMTDGRVYQKGFSSTYPTKDLISSAQVLYESESVQTLDKDGIRDDLINPESRIVRYHYAENRLKLDSQQPNELGAGSLGFRVVKALDVNRNVETATTYVQNDFPFTGRIRKIEKRDLGTGWKLETQAPIDQKLTYALPGGNTYRVVPYRHTTRVYEENTLAGQEVQAYQGLDPFGNVTLVFSEVDSSFVHHWFRSDTTGGEWYVGIAVREAISTSSDPGNTAAFHKLKSWDIDFAPGNSLLHIRHDSSWVRNADGNWRPIVKSFSYDGFGNVVAHTAKASPTGPPLVSKMEYESRFHAFLIGQKNPLGHLVQMRVDPRTGNITWLKDSNGMHQSYEYDGFGRKTKVYAEAPTGIQTGLGIPGTGSHNLMGDTLESDQFHYHTGTLTAGSDYEIAGGATVSLTSGTQLRLQPGFRARAGSGFFGRVASMQLVRVFSHDWADPVAKKGFRVKVSNLRKNWVNPTAADYSEKETYTDSWGRTYLRVEKGGSAPDIHVRSRFNAVGLVAASSAPYFPADAVIWTETAYDYKNRPLLVTFPGHHPDSSEVISYVYGVASLNGKPHRSIDQRGRRSEHAGDGYHSRTLEDAKGRPVCRIYFHNGDRDTIFYSYDLSGRITSVLAQRNALGQRVETQSVYDGLGRKTDMWERVWDGATVIDSAHFAYTFDDLGKVVMQRDPAGNVKTFTYDELGRIEREYFAYDLPELTNELVEVRHGYDSTLTGIGKPATVSGYAANGASLFRYGYEYDHYGNLVREDIKVAGWGETATTQVAYQPSGAKQAITFPDGKTVSMDYSRHGHLQNLHMNTVYGVVSADYSNYNAYGKPGTIALGNGVQTDYVYQPQNGRLAGMDILNDNVSLAQRTYHWDDHGMLHQIGNGLLPSGTQTFEYDDMLRLSQAVSGMYSTRNYDFDAAGNLKTKAHLRVVDMKGDRVTRCRDLNAGLIWYDYDANGNLLEKEVGAIRGSTDNHKESTRFDPNHRLVYFRSNDGKENKYLYDHLGRRIRKTESDGAVTFYLSPGYEVLVNDGQVCRTKYINAGPKRLIQVTTAD